MSEGLKLSERQLGVVDYFSAQLKEFQDGYNAALAKLQQYVTDTATSLGIDIAKYQLDLNTGEFTPVPEQSAD